MTGQRKLTWLKWVLFLAALLAIGITAGAQRVWLSDFVAINGDFQSYNALRRFLDGQVPYRDFTNYLGMGLLWANAPLLALRNTFTGSLFVTNAVTAVLCCVTVWAVLVLATRRPGLSMAAALLTPLLYRWEATAEYFALFVPGTSMRLVRAFLPILLAGVLMLATRKAGWVSLDVFHSRKTMALCGAALGLGAVWANDYGYAAIGAGLCILLVLTVFQNPRRPLAKLLDYLTFLGCVLAGYLLMVTAVTGGSPQSFFAQSGGVMGYQFWYYTMSVGKFFTLKDLLTGSPAATAQVLTAALLLLVFVGLYVAKKLTVRGVALLFIELTAFFAHLIYGYGSGHYLSGFLLMTNALLLAGGLLRLVLDGLEHALPAVRKTAFPLSAALLAALCLFSLGQARQPLQALSGPREGVYVAELDGWFSDGQTTQEAAQLLENGDYFSTYASALETIHGTFQPTGTDYIIHALGDGQRADYLANFLGGEYPYAVTIYKEYTAWEWWVQRANWFFYRELYANYAPLQTAGYAQLWQRQEGGAILEDMDYTLTTQQLDEDRVSIRIELPPEFAEGRFVADVALTYETAPDGWSLHRAVMVEDGTLWGYDGVYFLPEGSRTLNIPISVKNGAGEVTLVARPQETSSLLGVDAQVERFFDQEKLDYAFSG